MSPRRVALALAATFTIGLTETAAAEPGRAAPHPAVAEFARANGLSPAEASAQIDAWYEAVGKYIDPTVRIDNVVSLWRQVAAERGWSEAAIAAWEPFIVNVIGRETGHTWCYNIRGGDRVDDSCNVTRHGRRSGHYSDAGLGQVNGVNHGRGRNPRAWLCAQEGLCSAEEITATPRASITALIAVIERGGRQPWCFTKRLRRGDVCTSAPAGKPFG